MKNIDGYIKELTENKITTTADIQTKDAIVEYLKINNISYRSYMECFQYTIQLI